MPVDQNRAELVRQARLLNQEIDAALDARRIRAQAAEAAGRGEALGPAPAALSTVPCGFRP